MEFFRENEMLWNSTEDRGTGTRRRGNGYFRPRPPELEIGVDPPVDLVQVPQGHVHKASIYV